MKEDHSGGSHWLYNAALLALAKFPKIFDLSLENSGKWARYTVAV